MPATLIQQINRQCAKIKRIATSTGSLKQYNPNIALNCDKIFYSALKIQKIMTKLKQSQLKNPINQIQLQMQHYQVQQLGNQQDPYDVPYNNTIKIINKFENTIQKAQRKISILLNQTRIPLKFNYDNQQTKQKKPIRMNKTNRQFQTNQKKIKKRQFQDFDQNESIQAIDRQIYEILKELEKEGQQQSIINEQQQSNNASKYS